MKDDTYYFHQTPELLCRDIISNIAFEPDDIVFEPFAGENNFFKNFPQEITKYRCEIEDGLDFKDFDYEGIRPSIIITNPPFRLETENGKKGYIYFNSSTIWEETPPKCIKHDNCNITICDDSCYSFDNNFKHYEDNKPLIDKYAKYREKYNLLLEQEEEERKKALRDGIDYKIDFENIERMSFDI